MNKEIEALITANEYLDKLKDGINKISIYMQEEKEKEALITITDIIDGIAWIADVIRLTKSSLNSKVDLLELNKFLVEIVEALQNEDFILVGDLFDYEILPILEEIHGEIKSVIEINKN